MKRSHTLPSPRTLCLTAMTMVVLAAVALPAYGDPAPLTAPLPSPQPQAMTLDEAQARLAEEVRPLGWVAFAARSPQGDWDIFLCRPDGSDLRNLTHTPNFNEAYPLFSRDGRRLLYRQLSREETINGNDYGAQGRLILADSNGAHAQPLGAEGEYPWASWSPDGNSIACLAVKGISIVHLADKKVERTMPRRGFFQQMTWSPDGKYFSGVSNNLGSAWSVARMDAATGKVNAISVGDSCTPDWFPDGQSIIYSRRPGQWTQLWMSDADGGRPRLLYAQDQRHIYGGHVSPDGKYVLFTGNVQEDGDPSHNGAPMNLMRLADAPIVAGAAVGLDLPASAVHQGPLLTLPAGWEPCWTASESPALGAGE